MLGRKFGEVRFGHRIRKNVGQTISTRGNSLANAALRRGMDHDKFVAFVGCGDRVFKLLLC